MQLLSLDIVLWFCSYLEMLPICEGGWSSLIHLPRLLFDEQRQRVLEVKGSIQILGLITPDWHLAEVAVRVLGPSLQTVQEDSFSLFDRHTARSIFGRQILIPHFYSVISSWTLQAQRMKHLLRSVTERLLWCLLPLPIMCSPASTKELMQTSLA